MITLFSIINIAISLFLHADATDVVADPLGRSHDLRPPPVQSFNQFAIKACSEFAGKTLPASAHASDPNELRTEFYNEAQNSASMMLGNSQNAAQYLVDCLSGKALPGCAENKTKFLRANTEKLKALRINAQWESLDVESKTNTGFTVQTALHTSGKLWVKGSRREMDPLTSEERSLIDRSLNSKGQDTQALRGLIRERRNAGVADSDMILVQFPWLAKQTKSTVDEALVRAGLQEQIEQMKKRKTKIDKMERHQAQSLAASPDLAERIILNQTDLAKKQTYCSIAEQAIRSQANHQAVVDLGLAASGMVGLALCPFTSGLTCLGVAAMGATAQGAYQLSSYADYQKSKADHAGGLMKDETFLKAQQDFQSQMAMTALAAAGSVGSGAMGAAKMIRNGNVREALSNLLKGPAQRRATNYLANNTEGSEDLSRLFRTMGEIESTKPGHLPAGYTDRIKGLVTRAVGDLHHSNQLRIVDDVDELLAQMKRSPKGSAAYSDAKDQIDLRLYTLDAILRNTKPGDIVQRVDEALKKLRIPDQQRWAIQHCVIHGGTKKAARNWDFLFFSPAYAVALLSGCNEGIKSVLAQQSKDGWIHKEDGSRVRFLIEKWDCSDCGSTEIPAYVHVINESNKEDLAKVSHCSSCGQPREEHERYYENWERRSGDNQIIAEERDVVKGSDAQKTAKHNHDTPDEFCGFCGTQMPESQDPRCKSCGSPSVRHLTHPPRPGEAPAPRAKNDDSPAAPTDPAQAARSRPSPPPTRARAPRDSSGGGGGSSDATGSGNGVRNAAIAAGGVAAVGAVGYGGYQLFRTEDITATVTNMGWRHRITLEKLITVPHREWKKRKPSHYYGESNCRSEKYDTQKVVCGSHKGTIPGRKGVKGKCRSGSKDGITIETCDPDEPDTPPQVVDVPDYCDEPIYETKCDYYADEWVYGNHKETSGGVPSGTSDLPWPDLRAAGAKERVLREATYSVEFGFDAFGKPRRQKYNPRSEMEFQSWRPGNKATGKFSRGGGLSELHKK